MNENPENKDLQGINPDIVNNTPQQPEATQQNFHRANGFIPNTENINNGTNQQINNMFHEESYYDNHPLPQNNPIYNMYPMYRDNSYFCGGNNIPPQNPDNKYNQSTGNPDIPPKKKNKAGLIAGLVIVGVLVFVFALPALIILQSNKFNDLKNSLLDELPSITEEEKPSETEFTISPTPENENASIRDKEGRLTTEGIAEKASPSVVGVLGTTSNYESQGSGIILSADGYVLTNAHVVENSIKTYIILNGEDKYAAEIIGTNTAADIAVVKFKPDTSLTPAELGESSKLKIGEQVITIGNPRGLWGTFTGGYVSGIRDLDINNYGKKLTYIQTDAPVNYGNSGGPMLNMYGQVVGIVSAKHVQDAAEGLGFAIAIDDALPIAEEIIANRNVTSKVKIGITFMIITREDAQKLGIKAGFYIDYIDEKCDIANTELRKGDIITHINGKRIYSTNDIASAIGNKKPGDKIKAEVYRKTAIGDEETFEIEFKLMEK